MTISDEAVEALAIRLFQWATDEPWEAASHEQEAVFREQARRKLGAGE